MKLLEGSDINWTYFSPAAFFEPGERTGKFRLGKNQLIVDLGGARVLVPQDRFSFGGSSRLMDIGFSIKGLRLSVFGFLEEDIGSDLNDNLRAFLRDTQPAAPHTEYDVLPSGRAQAGSVAITP